MKHIARAALCAAALVAGVLHRPAQAAVYLTVDDPDGSVSTQIAALSWGADDAGAALEVHGPGPDAPEPFAPCTAAWCDTRIAPASFPMLYRMAAVENFSITVARDSSIIARLCAAPGAAQSARLFIHGDPSIVSIAAVEGCPASAPDTSKTPASAAGWSEFLSLRLVGTIRQVRTGHVTVAR